MADFESWRQYWEFSEFIRLKSRYILDARNEQFLKAILETSAKRLIVIEKGALLWRAQQGCIVKSERSVDEEGVVDCFETEYPLEPGKMVPKSDRAFEGRVNPKGIPCLYLSTDEKTAMTETRPWSGSFVSVGQFAVLEVLKVVDCSATAPRRRLYLGEPAPNVRENCVWGDINRAFSEPVTRTDDVADYAPTQVLAEAFRSAGYDGVVYESRLGCGKNVALFDLSAAELAKCHLCRVEAVNLKFTMAANPYYMERYCETDNRENNQLHEERPDPGR